MKKYKTFLASFIIGIFFINSTFASTEVPMMTPRADDYQLTPSVPQEKEVITEKKVEQTTKPEPTTPINKTIDIPMVQKSFNSDKADYETVKEFYYSPRQIFRINTREAMSTTIILPEGEVIKRIAVGDETSFSAEEVEENILMVFPQKVKRDTSITIISNAKKVYTFYIKSLSFDDKTLPDLVVRIKGRGMGFSNNSNNSPSVTNSANKINNLIDADFLDEAPLNPEKINWNYKMKGNKSIAPSRVWNDGNFTYLDFTNKEVNKSAVAVYKVKDQIDTNVNVRWNGNILIVETVGNLTLLNGKRHICIELLL